MKDTLELPVCLDMAPLTNANLSVIQFHLIFRGGVQHLYICPGGLWLHRDCHQLHLLNLGGSQQHLGVLQPRLLLHGGLQSH